MHFQIFISLHPHICKYRFLIFKRYSFTHIIFSPSHPFASAFAHISPSSPFLNHIYTYHRPIFTSMVPHMYNVFTSSGFTCIHSLLLFLHFLSALSHLSSTHHSSASYVPQMSHLDMSFCRFYTVICPHIMFTFSHPVILTSTHLVITSSHLLVISYINIQTSSSYLHIFASFRFLIFTFRPHISHHHVITCSHLRISPPVFSSTSCFFFVSFGGGRCQRGSMTLTFLRENQVGSATTMGQSRNTFIHRHVYKQTGVRTSKIAFLLHF